MSLLAELRRRNVFRVGATYLLASWVLLQIMDVVSPLLNLPDWAPRLMLVILGIGFLPVLLFAWAFELTPDGIKRESDVDRSVSVSNETGAKLNIVIVVFLAVAIGMQFLLWRQGPDAGDAAGTTVADATSNGATATDSSIAVLPFVNMSSDEEQEYFSDGITEEILNSLASVRELKVAGRTSSFAFKGQNDDLRRIGEALGVSHILEGSVRKAGDQVRITAQLIKVDDGFHVWSQNYDRELTNVFAIQEEIANEILGQLTNHLLPADTRVADVRETTPEVFDLYLKAKQRIYTRERLEIETAVEELDRAIQADPDYAPLYAQRGVATMLLSEQQYGTLPDDEANRRGKRFIDKALELDDNLAEGWAALGLYHGRMPGTSEAAIEPLMRALELNPNLIDASNWLQIALNGVGDFKGSLEVLIDATERDPLYRPAFSNALMSFNQFGQPERAEALLRKIEALDADNPDLLSARAINYLFSGRSGEGLQQMEMRSELGPMSGVERVFLSVGLLNTYQYERAAEEGSQFFRPDALFKLGRKEEAYEMAYDFASSGFPETLFVLLNRDGRSKDVVDYLEERWPGIQEFADENPGTELGYAVMTEVALAYQRVGNRERFDEAMAFVDAHLVHLDDQGLDNYLLDYSTGIYYALEGNADLAIEHLARAADQGLPSNGPMAEISPALAVLEGDPRFADIEDRMRATTNRDRAVVGLPPLDADFQVVDANGETSL